MQVSGTEPETAEDWMRLAHNKARVSRTLLQNMECWDAWSYAGNAVECALKAAVMMHERHNRTPSWERDRDFYTHDLRYLAQRAGLNMKDLLPLPVAPKFQTVFLWRRGDTYKNGGMPLKVARDMVMSATSPEGVIKWLESRFHLDL